MELESIKGYLDADGRITQIPSKRKKKIYVLSYLADSIPVGQKFTEMEFNGMDENSVGLFSFFDAIYLSPKTK